MTFIYTSLRVKSELLQCENISSLAPRKSIGPRNSYDESIIKCTMNIKSSRFYKHNIKNTSCDKWNRWNVIQKQCIMGCFELKNTQWQIHFSKKVPIKRNEQIIPKWSICNFSGHMTSLHNIYISSMLKGNYVQHIHTSHMVAGNGHQRCIIFTAHRLDLETEWFKS